MTFRNVTDGFWRRFTPSCGHRLYRHTFQHNLFGIAPLRGLSSRNQDEAPSSTSSSSATEHAIRDQHTLEQPTRSSSTTKHSSCPTRNDSVIEDGARDLEASDHQVRSLRIARHFAIPKTNKITFRAARSKAAGIHNIKPSSVLYRTRIKETRKPLPLFADVDASRVEPPSRFPQPSAVIPRIAPVSAKITKSSLETLQTGSKITNSSLKALQNGDRQSAPSEKVTEESEVDTLTLYGQSTLQTSVRQPAPSEEIIEEPEVDILTLYGKLRRFAAAGKAAEVEACIRTLVQKRGEKPNLKLYSALILVNVSAADGSAAEVGAVLQEMEMEGFVANTETHHDALKALAVHPDSIIRGQVLDEMRQRWFVLTPSGWHDVIAGYTREGLLEQALETLEDMQAAGVPVQGWLHDLIIYTLCDFDEIDQALAMMKFRVWTGDHIVSTSTWYYFFDAACRYLHYDALHFIWQRRVEQHYLNPTSGQCFQVLNAAARQGDIQIATDVFRVLSKRATAFESQHYELLIEAYIRAGNIRTALTILCIMHTAGINPNSSATSAIATYLKQSPDRAQEAFVILKELKEARTVPTEAMNRIIEACVAQNGLVEAIEMYKSLHRICPDGPNVTTFNALLAGCRDGVHKDTAMFLASEMLELKIMPNVLTYDRLILVCLGDKEYEDALRYYREMRQSGFAPRQGTFLALIRRCCDAGDERAWELLKTMSSLGLEDAKIKRYVNENFPDTRMDGRRHIAQQS